MKQDQAQPSAIPMPPPGGAEMGRYKILDDLLSEVRRSLERTHDPQHVSRVLTILTEQFRGARITNFLPMLIRKKAADYLATASRTSSTAKAPTTTHSISERPDGGAQ